MEIVVAIILTLLTVVVLYLIGWVKDLARKIDGVEFWEDDLRDRVSDVEDEVYDIKNNKKGK